MQEVVLSAVSELNVTKNKGLDISKASFSFLRKKYSRKGTLI